MEIRLIENKDVWNTWATQNKASFLQSYEWGAILIAEGKQVKRLGALDNGQLVAAAQIVPESLPFGWRYAFCPGGPIVCGPGTQYGDLLGDHLKIKKCIFFRFEPNEKPSVSTYAIQRSVDVDPRATMVLDLMHTADALLAAMHQKTRYNIRLAEKKGLRISSEKNIMLFTELMKKTGSRDKFKLHGQKHYDAIFASPFSRQLTIWSGDTPVATGVFIGFGDTYTYLYGASDHDYRELMAPYLLQWQAIQEGKKLGFARYDFFGIAPGAMKNDEYVYDQKHQYAGVTRFKLGFGGQPLTRPGTFDLLISPKKYRMYKLMRAIRRMI